MQTLNIKVTQQAVILQNKDPVTAENVNQIRCVVELDPAYADLIMRVCMNGQFATVVDGQCFAPPLQEGMCRLGVYGYAMDGEQLVQRISPEPCVFYVRPGSYDPAPWRQTHRIRRSWRLIMPRCRRCSKILARA